MAIRVVLVRLRDDARDDATRQAVVDAAREVFPEIPGVVDFEAGVATDPTDWDLVLLVHFASSRDIEAYRMHPLHVAFVNEHLKPRLATLEARNFV